MCNQECLQCLNTLHPSGEPELKSEGEETVFSLDIVPSVRISLLDVHDLKVMCLSEMFS